jgi:nucleotide-binding universal stress UspA family protein
MAVEDFQAARQRAALQEILARFTGKSTQLLSYEDVAEKLKLRIRTDRGLQQIPLDAIVGSVGRYAEFTRSFLPRRMEDRERWARLKAAMYDGTGMPPIEVYKVGEAYFVVDGNHRVSIARQEGLTSIEANVVEFKTDVHITPDLQVDDLISKAEYAAFLNATRIHDARPNVDLSVTSCCQYDKLLQQIRILQILMQEQGKEAGASTSEVPLQDAAAAWYDTIYTPLAEAIRDRGLLHWFPNRTVTDLYIWISENRAALEQELGWTIQSDAAATDLILARGVTTETGSWRKARTVARYTEQLFKDILVPLSGEAESWEALTQALSIAGREKAKIHGLHIVDSEEAVSGATALAVQQRFHQLCAEAGVDGRLATEAGEVTRKICERATMADLVVLKVVHPPVSGLGALRSPLRTIIAGSSRPVLAVPAVATPLRRALLAYDGSELAKEALFVAAYLAEVWKTELLVFTAREGTRIEPQVQDYVRRYLELHEVTAEYIVSERGATESLKQTADEREVDLVLMGSHGGTVVRQVLIGSALDYMLRESRVPIFVCR